ncbi:MAG TPA: DUF2339 domain-containing protein [Terracidiphilus sp.]
MWEMLILPVVAVLVAVPVIVILAFIKGSGAFKLGEANSYSIADLRGEIAALQKEVARLSQVIQRLQAAPAAAGTPEAATAHPAQKSDAPHKESEAVSAGPRAAATAAPQPAPTAPIPQPVREPQPAMEALPAAAAHAPVVQTPTAAFRPAASPPAPPPQPKPAPASIRPSHAAPASQLPPPPPSIPHVPASPRGPSFAERLKSTLPLEQLLGMNLFAKIGIVLLVLGFALLGRVALISMGPAARVVLLYATAAAMLGGGIWLERRERYRLVGRAGIGGGWALLFFTTYAMHHVAAMTVLSSNLVDCILMLGVAGAMVAHTLRYRSQVVTGLAFLLAFSTVALSQDSVYALSAGVILALGIVAIALRMKWYELEVFGIVSSYANHFYWLYKLYPDGVAGHLFPQFWSSAIILILYWAVFRFSYIVRRVELPRQESISTIAALLNTMLLLVVMKFQATHPELAFYALLGLGGLEFACGQLPITRRRRSAFALLTVIGTLLIFAAVPFKFSGNNIALFWMIAAETLLIAGIVQRERLFRVLGLIAGALTGLLIVIEAQNIVSFRQTSEAGLTKDGILLLTCSLLFYFNAHYLRTRWSSLFEDFEDQAVSVQSYLGGLTAFLGVWAIFTSNWTAAGWAALLIGAAFGARKLHSRHLLIQAWAFTAAVAIRAAIFNCHFGEAYPHHIAARLITLPLLAVAFYIASWALHSQSESSYFLDAVALWAGTFLLASLAWLEISQPWVAPVWAAFAVALCLSGRRLNLPQLNFQEHALALATAIQLFVVNLGASSAVNRYIPLVGCAAVFYAVSRFSTQRNATYRRGAAWIHTWAATALLAALAWHESPQPWLAVIWILFALSLAIVDRIFKVEELPWQAHVLSLLAVLRAVSFSLFDTKTWHGVDLRLITVSILVAVLYTLARLVRLPEKLQNSEIRHIYTWVSTGLAAWMLWCELQPLSLAPALGVFGLLLFEIGMWRAQRQLRLQSYALLAASFPRIFFVNLTAAKLPGELVSPRIYTIVPLALIYFYVWFRLQSAQAKPEIGSWRVGSFIAWFGTGSIVALLYYEMIPAWIIAGWALAVTGLMLAALLLDEEIFVQQGVLLAAGIVVRGLAHNLFGASYFVSGGWRGKFSVLSITAAILFGTLPLAFRLRVRYATRAFSSPLSRWLAVHHPEQTVFFAPLVLIVFAIAIRMNAGMVTLSWGIVGLAVILLGLLVSQRSYRIAGLLLLLLCVGKIVFRDAWRLDERDRYITFIVLGAALTLVSTLYSRFRDQMSRLL